jgi:hypothetical protein
LMMWIRKMAQREKPEMHIFLYGNPKERDHLLGLDICRRMALTFMSCLSRPWCLNWCWGYFCNTYTAVCGFTQHSTAGNIPNKLCLWYIWLMRCEKDKIKIYIGKIISIFYFKTKRLCGRVHNTHFTNFWHFFNIHTFFIHLTVLATTEILSCHFIPHEI